MKASEPLGTFGSNHGSLQMSGGRFDFDDGGSYCGGWEDGKAHGHGICTGPKGQGEYSGSWHFGFEVSGVYTWPSGSSYEGHWQNGKRHGLGSEHRGRWLYRGEWTHGFKGRYGVRQATVSNAKYEGTWANGLQDGYGTETYADSGTFQGQWLRGMRHGYGVRTSAPFGVSLLYNRPVGADGTDSKTGTIGSTVGASSTSLNGRQSAAGAAAAAEDPESLQLARRVLEDTRGGFVLRTRSDEIPKRRKSLVERSGMKNFVQGLRLRKQKSAGDIEKKGILGSLGSASTSGIRSTGSTSSWMSTDTQYTANSAASIGSNLSFNPEEENMDSSVTETYMGEWKNDKRSGFGVAERSDGLKYEGEWYNNRKYGYGVTTFRDGSKEEGKYKNNILLTSSEKRHVFLMRSAKFRERIDSALNAAGRASKIALQKADIAISRTATSRGKAEQADIASVQAREDGQLANQLSSHYQKEIVSKDKTLENGGVKNFLENNATSGPGFKANQQQQQSSFMSSANQNANNPSMMNQARQQSANQMPGLNQQPTAPGFQQQPGSQMGGIGAMMNQQQMPGFGLQNQQQQQQQPPNQQAKGLQALAKSAFSIQNQTGATATGFAPSTAMTFNQPIQQQQQQPAFATQQQQPAFANQQQQPQQPTGGLAMMMGAAMGQQPQQNQLSPPQQTATGFSQQASPNAPKFQKQPSFQFPEPPASATQPSKSPIPPAPQPQQPNLKLENLDKKMENLTKSIEESVIQKINSNLQQERQMMANNNNNSSRNPYNSNSDRNPSSMMDGGLRNRRNANNHNNNYSNNDNSNTNSFSYQNVLNERFEHYKRPPSRPQSREVSVDRTPGMLAEANNKRFSNFFNNSRSDLLKHQSSQNSSQYQQHNSRYSSRDHNVGGAVGGGHEARAGGRGVSGSRPASRQQSANRLRAETPQRANSLVFDSSDLCDFGKDAYPVSRKKSLPDVQDLPGAVANQKSKEMTREEISILSSFRREAVRTQLGQNFKSTLFDQNKLQIWFNNQKVMLFILCLNMFLAMMFFKLLT